MLISYSKIDEEKKRKNEFSLSLKVIINSSFYILNIFILFCITIIIKTILHNTLDKTTIAS